MAIWRKKKINIDIYEISRYKMYIVSFFVLIAFIIV